MLSVKNKLMAGYGVLFLIIIASSLLSWLSSGKQEDVVEELMTEDLAVWITAYDITVLGLNYRRGEKDVLLNMGDKQSQTKYYKQLREDAEILKKKLGDLVKSVEADREMDAQDKKTVMDASQNISRYDQFLSAYLDDLISGKLSGVSSVEANKEIAKHKDEFHAFEKAMAGIREIGRRMVQDKADGMNGIAHTQSLTQWGVLLGGLIIGLASALFTILSISRPMKSIIGYSEAVSSGDLNASLPRHGKDEFAVLGGNIEKMVNALKVKIEESDLQTRQAGQEAERAREAMRKAEEASIMAERARTEGMTEAAHSIEQVVAVVATASEHLLEGIEQASQGARNQAQRVEETMSAMREMNATVLDVAKSAAQAADSTEKAKQDATAGAKVLSDVVGSIRRVQEQALALKGDMGDLGLQAEGIGRVMNVISDIADQTNLLALNAAIEAARAGDAGRGFAVVADEVRKLAEKTMNATREVGDAIQGIQQGTQKNIGNVDTAVGTIGTATDLAERSGQVLGGILELVQQAADQVRSIATASEQQSAASEQINRSIEEINTISSQTTDNIRLSSGEVEELSRQARVLSELVTAMESGKTSIRALGA